MASSEERADIPTNGRGELETGRGLARNGSASARRRRARGHIHRSRLERGMRFPAHLQPGAVEHMLVLEGVVETTAGRRCERGDFWTTPGVEHGPHLAVTDVEFITISIGAEGDGARRVAVGSPAAIQAVTAGSPPREARARGLRRPNAFRSLWKFAPWSRRESRARPARGAARSSPTIGSPLGTCSVPLRVKRRRGHKTQSSRSPNRSLSPPTTSCATGVARYAGTRGRGGEVSGHF
jgi:hypothetical protein